MKFPELKTKALLSPMAGVTDVAFRELCKKYGAALTYTEFINSTAITRQNKRTLEMLKTSPLEKPVAVQLFGNSIDDVIKAAQFCEKTFDIIDVNCGCPAWKVIKIGAGSELLKKPKGIADFIEKLVKNTNKPITLKIRAGIDDKNINAVEIAKLAEKAGASAIAVHGRTQKQGYSGKADWKIIKKVKQSAKIPIIGNGDIFTPEDFKKHLEESKVNYIMIARGAIGNPYIFKQIQDYLETGNYKQPNKIKLFKEYQELAQKYNIPFKQIKNHAVSFTKGIQGAPQLRKQIMQCQSIEELNQLFN